MSQHLLPTGCHDAATAATLLNMSKKALLKKMRELGWLVVAPKTDAHNLPRAEYIRRGWCTTQERGYCLKGKSEIGKTYSVMLLTQKGFEALKNELLNPKQNNQTTAGDATNTAQKAPAQHQREPEARAVPVVTFNRYAIEREHQKFLDRMAELNIPIAVGQNK